MKLFYQSRCHDRNDCIFSLCLSLYIYIFVEITIINFLESSIRRGEMGGNLDTTIQNIRLISFPHTHTHTLSEQNEICHLIDSHSINIHPNSSAEEEIRTTPFSTCPKCWKGRRKGWRKFSLGVAGASNNRISFSQWDRDTGLSISLPP